MWLITSSLLNAWRVLLEEEYGSEQEFLNVLNRIPAMPTEAIEKGIAFEKWACENLPIVKGGLYQVRISKNIGDYLLYGVIDVIKAGTVYDLKYTSNYEVGKFIKNYQTSVYLELVHDAKEMTYVVSDKESEGEIWLETYKRTETQPIMPVIEQFMGWLCDKGYMDIYRAKWKCKEG
jgi:hypothetical protein